MGVFQSLGAEPPAERRRQREWLTFLAVSLVLVPALSVAVVGGYGLMVWIYQMLAGPPGPS